MKIKLFLLCSLIIGGILYCYGQVSEQEYKDLSKLFSVDVQLMGDAVANFENYKSSRQETVFTHQNVLRLNKSAQTSLQKILVVVETNIYEQLSYKIERYARDINYVYGCEVIVERVSGGKCTDIKNLILANKANLDGVVFIGDIVAAWYEISNDHDEYGYRSWPCDLYYMDIDGVWTDVNQNGIFDAHTGNVQPEIFVGRMVVSMRSLVSEKDALSRYLDRNHDYWLGNVVVNRKYALTYTDKDWVVHKNFRTDIKSLYGDLYYDTVTYYSSTFGKSDYLRKITDNRYEFIQLSCHANPTYLAMSNGGIYSDEIYRNKTKTIGLNLFCCSACDWTSATYSQGFLAGAHIYNTDGALVVVGSTKTGSMLDFSKFYQPLGQKKTIGEALKLWWINSLGSSHSEYKVSWHYGMSIIGDPLINFHHNMTEECASQVVLNAFDSSNPASCHYIVAKDKIIVNNYIIPAGKHVIFRAKEVVLNPGFECNKGGSFEIINEGCEFNNR